MNCGFEVARSTGTRIDEDQQDAGHSELPWPIPRYSVESDHGCTSMFYFDNADDSKTMKIKLFLLEIISYVIYLKSPVEFVSMSIL